MKSFLKKCHKWIGLIFTFFIIMFCLSGIILNHRKTFSGLEISRNVLPKDYRYDNWNNGLLRGSIKTADDAVLYYGNAGIWKTDSCFSASKEYNEGLKKGVANRKIANMAVMPDGSVWCAGLYDIYRLDGEEWLPQEALHAEGERLTDLTSRGDTLVVISRSEVFQSLPPYSEFTRYQLKDADKSVRKVSLFRTMWLIHSGEMFGLPGQLFVDLVAIVITILCITGLIYVFVPKIMKKRKAKKKSVKTQSRFLKYGVKWHNKLGSWTIVFTVLLAFTGMCLRPPLMIPFVMGSTNPIPGSILDSDNPWVDKLRCAKWDNHLQRWILHSSSGFFTLTDWESVPQRMKGTPPVSPMGINVFAQDSLGADSWIVGSFSGIFRWNPETGEVLDYLTGEKATPHRGMPAGGYAVAGYTDDWKDGACIFGHGGGARPVKENAVFSEMPEEMKGLPMSLWNFALEVHVGRMYTLLNFISPVYVFLSGLFLILTLLTGYIIYKRRKKKKKPETVKK